MSVGIINEGDPGFGLPLAKTSDWLWEVNRNHSVRSERNDGKIDHFVSLL